MRMVLSQPFWPGTFSTEESHAPNFSSQLRPELAAHATPASFAFVVSLSAHWFCTDQTSASVEATAGPAATSLTSWPLESSVPSPSPPLASAAESALAQPAATVALASSVERRRSLRIIVPNALQVGCHPTFRASRAQKGAKRATDCPTLRHTVGKGG